MRILVTGGAGYIGSHVVHELLAGGHEVVVYDNLSTGHAWAVGEASLVVADLADRETLASVLREGFDAVMHFAAHIVVPESIADPLRYYANNTGNTLGLLTEVTAAGVPQFVFSSTAAVYGIPETELVSEDTPLAPINPYGASKMMSERMLMDAAAASSLRYGILRYFNVAGAHPDGHIGQATPAATHLIKVACQTALGRRPSLSVFGTDYATPDGTCVRDYIHVVDLARAHVQLLDHLAAGGDSRVYNCGYGHGSSVREVVDTVRRVHGAPFEVEEAPRRAGDPPALVADSTRLRRELGWTPAFDDLETIVRHAYQWESRYEEE
ncbi:UDP-glucose 4-epimerase [wastewater metagenome]|uniref:UDP-glucose 4-epimerase n=4 Tax=root TaxID=1 RepID=A0A5B8RAY6_9ZZZZ|nr:UDP-glucose 4-epimerase GalE [Arhodomonas aquaeolei]MCS4504001.1 UDP-glucose 4-epimerase GalE [Arhodomonas aquaeolei]QEA05771.1 UDP-glucose 4-epimerase [uncultured organism]